MRFHSILIALSTAITILCPQANGTIIYSGNINFPVSGNDSDSLSLSAANILQINTYFYPDSHTSFGYNSADITTFTSDSQSIGNITAALDSSQWAIKLPSGVSVDSWLNFDLTKSPLLYSINGNRAISGNFVNSSGYIGLRFTIDGSIHYGWAPVATSDVIDARGAPLIPGTVRILEWAYQTESDTPILTGSTSAVPEAHTISYLAFTLVFLAFLISRTRRCSQPLAARG